jgi:hypothetical protein
LRPFLLFLASSLGFLAVATPFRRMVPWPDDQALWQKWVYFAAHKDEFDAVWIGTSLVLRDVDVPAIERGLAEAGVELHSFNFGMGGMGTYEQDFLLHRLLELEPARLKYVFLEGGPVGLGIHPRHIFQSPGDLDTFRSVFWHDWTQTGKVLGQTRRLPHALPTKLELAFTHLRLCARKFANYGLGPQVPRFLEGPGAPSAIMSEDLGFRPYPEPHGTEFTDPAAYAQRVREVEAQNRAPLELEELHTEVHAAQYAAVDARGAELIYLCLPASIGEPERPFLHAQGVIPWLFDFSQPSEHPELFRFEHRWDEDHLNRDGVALLTPLLVERILAHRKRS